jgi:hypothetical protein
VSPANIVLGQLTLGNSALNAGGNTSVTIQAQSSAVAVGGVNISLTADCGTIANVVTTDGSGLASATYSSVKADGSSCSGTVTISAFASGSAVKKASLTVAAPVANAINFVSATPAQIFVKASGSTEQSIVQFKVLDSVGKAMPNVPVVFTLTVNPGGVGLGASGSLGSVTVNSDSAGIASMSVFSGTIPGPVEVKAALQNFPSVFTTSKNLTVASGPPSQNFFSISADTFNIEGWDIDGTTANLTVRVADRQGNPVPDGTVINFTANGGQVATSCATVRVSGIAQCSVAFMSQAFRPVNGRISILAYAEGLKQFTDINGNNAYDVGVDVLADLGDAYRDDNENGQYDLGEFVIPKGGVLGCPAASSGSPSRANTCTGSSVLAATVRKQMVLTIPSSFATFTVVADAGTSDPSFVTVRMNSAPHPLLPMPAGTTVSADALLSTCTIGKISPSVVPNVPTGSPSSQMGTLHSIGLTGCGGSTIRIIATAPSGSKSSALYDVPNVFVPPPVDTTPPNFTSAPAIDLIATTSARLSLMLNESASGYFLISTTATAPSLAVLESGTATPPTNAAFNTPYRVALTGGVPYFYTFTVLSTGTTYYVHFIAKDLSGNSQTTVSTASFTTP